MIASGLLNCGLNWYLQRCSATQTSTSRLRSRGKLARLEEETFHAQFEDGKVREQVVLPVADLRLEVLLHPRQVARVIPVCRVSVYTHVRL